MHSLPSVKNIAAFQAWRAEPSQWLPAALDIARGHGLPHARRRTVPHRHQSGRRARRSVHPEDFSAAAARAVRLGAASLSQLARTARHCRSRKSSAKGERDRWPYLVITRLPGILGTQAWPTLPEDQRGARAAPYRCDDCGGAARSARRLARYRAALGRVDARPDRGMPGEARASRIAAKISRRAGRSACATRPSSFPWTQPR